MKKISLLVAAIALCAPFTSMANGSRWYGLLTLGQFPISGCVVTDVGTVESSTWVDGASPQKLAQFRSDFEEKFANNVKSAGYNAVLGFTTTFLGGSALYNGNTYLGGVLVMRGTEVKVRCGK